MNDPRGSIWRKWDLHFHTPSSFDYGDKSITDKAIIEGLIGAGIAAVAITDHHVIDVLRIENLQKLAGNRLAVFPGIELRSELGGRESVHLIGIFAEDCDLNDIWTKMQGLLRMTPSDVAGKGIDKFYVSFRESANVIHGLNGLVSAHAGTKSNSMENIANEEAFKQAVKEDLAKDCIDILEIGRLSDEKDYKGKVFPDIGFKLPLVICSDNHRIAEYELKVPLWIKADTTFAGLKQMLNEPTGRVFLGDTPPVRNRVEQNRTKYIKSVSISKIANSALSEIWFDCTVPFNHELTAIIGNKGSGKSALSDTLGLLGNSAHNESFSFLHIDKFKKQNKAKNFEATLNWESGPSECKNLNDMVDKHAVETIKYIPQNHLETICTELKEIGDGQFDRELKAVIFSHVDEVNKLGAESLDDLIKYKTQETYKAIDILKDGLRTINLKIVSLEEQLTDNYRVTISNQLAEKERILAAHNESKPVKVNKPETDPHTQKTISDTMKKFKNVQRGIKNLIGKIKTLSDEHKKQVERESTASRLLAKIKNFNKQYEAFKENCIDDFEELGLILDDVLKINIKSELVEEIRNKANEQIEIISKSLDPDNPESFVYKKIVKEKKVEDLRKNLDKPNQHYQAYIKALEDWKTEYTRIKGDKKTPGSIKYLENQLADIKKVPDKLSKAEKQRLEKVKEIFSNIKNLSNTYKTLHEPVQAFINTHPSIKGDIRLDFQVSIVDSGFAELFFDHITYGKHGSFCGIEEGRKRLIEILRKADFNSEQGVMRFLEDIIRQLTRDIRESDPSEITISEQLKKGATVQSFYDFLFSLVYLEPKYTLKWFDKDLDQLSPGERGTLLLVFYLLVDNSSIPLIIDQPEGNLDNETVYKTLVGCIKEAKTRRQIVIVTHNPNLAVVCDAEQIIYADLDKNQGNRVTYSPGAIENPGINQKIIDVLEGTKPAFDTRDNAYKIIGYS